MIHATASECSRTTRPRSRWLTKQGRRVCTPNFWLRKLPIIGFIRTYDLPSLLSDVIAGVTVGLTFIPTAMASALVAGLPSKHGLYTSLPSYFTYAVLGSRAEVNVGTNIVTALFCKPFVDAYGPDIVFTYCFYIGCIITLIGVLNLGFLLDFISVPVMEGFLSGASIAAGAGQIPALLGFRPGGSNFLQYVENIVRNIQSARVFDSALGLFCIALLSILSYCQKYGTENTQEEQRESVGQQFGRGILKYLSLSRTAIVIILSTAFAANVTWEDKPLVNIAGEIEEGLPELRLPTFTAEEGNRTLSVTETMKVLSPGAPITLVIIVISSAASKAFANGESVAMGQEMIAVGVSNLLSSLLQGVPATASVLMAIVNKSAGVKTTISNIFAGFVIVLSLCFFTNILKYFPTSTLAAIVLCSFPKVIRIHKYSAVLWKAKKSDLIPLHITFWVCLLVGLDAAMVAGIISNICLIMYEAARPKVQIEYKQVQQNVLIVRVDRAVTYPAAEYVKQRVTKHSLSSPPNLRVILDGTYVNSVDSTAIKVLMSLMSEISMRKQRAYMWNWRKAVINTFVKFDTGCAEYFRNEETLHQLINASLEPTREAIIPDDIESNEASLIVKNSIHTTVI